VKGKGKMRRRRREERELARRARLVSKEKVERVEEGGKTTEREEEKRFGERKGS